MYEEYPINEPGLSADDEPNICVKLIGILVKKKHLDSAMKSSFHKSAIEAIFEREETFE